jgi:putative transposase
MDEKHLLSTVRYVERNPVAARLCVNPQDWEWSSARAQLKGEDDELVSVEPMIKRVGNWTEYLSGSDDDSNNTDLIKQHTRTGRPLGITEFIRKLEVFTGEELAPKRPGRKPINRK